MNSFKNLIHKSIHGASEQFMGDVNVLLDKFRNNLFIEADVITESLVSKSSKEKISQKVFINAGMQVTLEILEKSFPFSI